MTQAICSNILEAIGRTPLVRLNRVGAEFDTEILVKPEFLNPAGSVKDRMAQYIIAQAEADGTLSDGGTIIENTSGNTGAGVAMVAAIKGYKATFTMPDKMSTEKVNMLKAYGAKVVITPTNVPPDSPESYYETAKRMVREMPGAFYLNQYHSAMNIEAHYRTTGPEIFAQVGGQLDAFIAGIGTGGTLSGAAKYLKEKIPGITIVAVDIEGSVFYDWFKRKEMVEPKVYKTEGIGDDMLTGAMDFTVVDDMVQVDDRESFVTARRLCTEEGMFCGGSSGSAVAGVLKYLKDHPGLKRVVTVLPDSGSRYLSKFYNDEWMRDNGFLDEGPRFGTVGDVMAAMQQEVVTAQPSDKVFRVVEIMKEKGISQMPVVKDGKLLGVINEAELLRHMMSGSHRIVEPIESMIRVGVRTVTPGTPLSEAARIFQNGSYNMAVVVDGEKLRGVLTKIDLIDHVVHAMAEC